MQLHTSKKKKKKMNEQDEKKSKHIMCQDPDKHVTCSTKSIISLYFGTLYYSLNIRDLFCTKEIN